MQAGRWLDYVAHSLQNIGQALYSHELLDTCKLVKRERRTNADRWMDGLPGRQTNRQTARFCCSQPLALWSGDLTTVETR